MKTERKAFSVMADGRNELYILAESAEEAEREYVERMKGSVKATSLDVILELADYREVIKDLERDEKERNGEIVKGYKFFIVQKDDWMSPIEYNEYEYVFKVGKWSVEGYERTSIRCFDTAENAVASFERRLDEIVESGREEICLNIWNAVLFECDCERSEKESVRMWSNCEWWDVPIEKLPKGTIVCDAVRVVKEVEISGKALEYKKILENREKSKETTRKTKPVKDAKNEWF